MKFKIISCSIRVCFFACILICQSDDVHFALPPSERVKENVLQLDLKIPHEVVIKGERPHIYLGVKNLSDTPFRHICGWLHSDVAEQLYFQARNNVNGPNLTTPIFLPSWKRIDDKTKLDGLCRLEKGEFIRHNHSRGHLNPAYDIIPPGTREIRIGILLGSNEWAFSKWVAVRRLDEVVLNEQQILSSIQYPAINTPHLIYVRRASVGDESHLFIQAVRCHIIPKHKTPVVDSIWNAELKTLLIYSNFVDSDYRQFTMDVGGALIKEWDDELSRHATTFLDMQAELGGEQYDVGRRVR
jgi:hypothetical protein